MSFISEIIEIFFPTYCVGCRARGGYLCAKCAKMLLPATSTENTWVTSVFAYQDPKIRNLVRILKFKNGKKVAKLFAPYLASSLSEFFGEEKNFISPNSVLIVPIPLSKKRFKKRGYNQAELLARETAKSMQGNFLEVRTDILKKTKETIAQTDMKRRAERMKNITDCFSVSARDEDIKKTVIIFDDVTTTGATLISAKRALREAGFRKIYALTVAH